MINSEFEVHEFLNTARNPSFAKMVIKTNVCAFSEMRIYPGHGISYIRKDGQLVTFFSSKCKSLYLQRKKPAKLTWTVAWRRLNKKTQAIDVNRRKRNRARKIARGIQGISVAEIQKRRRERPEVRKANRDAALREVKDRKKTGKKSSSNANKLKQRRAKVSKNFQRAGRQQNTMKQKGLR